MQARGLRWPQFRGEEIRHLSAYLRVMNPESMKEEAYSSPGNPERGGAVFEAKGCKKCHAIYGDGGTTGPDLGQRTVAQNVTEIAGAMWNHATGMRTQMKKQKIPWPEFSGSEMTDVIAYIYSIGLKGPPGDPGVGQGIFTARGCSSCHAIHGKDGKTGPDLARTPAFSTPMQLVQVMWNHAPLMQKEMEAKALPWPQFQGNEVADLYAYLQAVRSAGKP